MSSILIKGMEMPVMCSYCKFREPFIDSAYCHLAEMDMKYEESDNCRHPNCPLVEIPAPHGRLIDATFEENHYASMLLDPTPDVTEQDKHKARIIIEALRMAGTVIEAEGREE